MGRDRGAQTHAFDAPPVASAAAAPHARTTAVPPSDGRLPSSSWQPATVGTLSLRAVWGRAARRNVARCSDSHCTDRMFFPGRLGTEIWITSHNPSVAAAAGRRLAPSRQTDTSLRHWDLHQWQYKGNGIDNAPGLGGEPGVCPCVRVARPAIRPSSASASLHVRAAACGAAAPPVQAAPAASAAWATAGSATARARTRRKDEGGARAPGPRCPGRPGRCSVV